ncbi:MAG: dUTP diphosphatase [Spirochaetia bacterium]|jgi:dUTP pyrophosphatase|nr:dUTP diphosphatase [Spirochaetia bacterium]
MAVITIPVCTEDRVSLPLQATALSAGADLRAHLDGELIIKPMERVLVPTGLKLSIPEGFEAQVRPRSGLAIRNGITVLNAPGTIDADYRGEVKVILINLGNETFHLNDGDRIAQLVIVPVCQVSFKAVATLDVTERGEGGFGSTGV